MPHLLALAPDAAACFVLVVSLLTGLQLVVRSFHPWPTLVVSVVGAVLLTWRLYAREPFRARGDAVWSVVAVVVAAAVTLFNATVSSQWLTVTRDPGFYTVAAKWLTEHASPIISRPTESFGLSDSIVATAGFSTEPHQWQVQSSHLVPALVAIVGEGGDDLLLAGNTVIGFFALICLYAAGRRIVGPAWAVLPVVALGCSLPFCTFTRGIYTEPLALAVGFGALALTLHWLRAPTALSCVAAGLLAGASSMVRIDGLVQTIALVAGVVVVTATSARGRGRPGWGQATTYALAAAAAGLLGWLELKRNSAPYLAALGSQVRMLQLLAAATVVAALVLAVLCRTTWWSRLVTGRQHPRWALGAGVAVVVVMGVLAARPLFWQSHTVPAGTSYAALVQNLQTVAGATVDPTRGYDELSVQWIVWYFGVPAVIAGTLGLAVLAHRAVRRGDRAAVLTVLLIGGMSLLYLTRVSISPDQIWASRRFVPIIFPGFLLGAAVALRWLAARRRPAAVLAALVAVSMVALPLLTLRPLAREPELAGWRGPVDRVCDVVEGGRLLIAQPRPWANQAVTFRTWCDVPVAAVPEGAKSLRRIAAADPRPLFVLSSTPQIRNAGPVTVIPIRSSRYVRTLTGPPKQTEDVNGVFYVRRVEPRANR